MSADQSTTAPAAPEAPVEYRELHTVPGYEEFSGYRVGNDGTVWTRTSSDPKPVGSWRQMKGSPCKKGYLRVNVFPREGKYLTRMIHRLVLEAFVGPRPEGMECRHENGTKADNRLSNIRWGTPEQNRDDNRRLDVYGRGEGHTQAKLTEDSVRQIRSRVAAGEAQTAVAAAFGVHNVTVNAIVHRRTWKHVA